MSIRWHRSRLFWLGLVGLVMLLFAWFSYPACSLSLSYTTESSLPWPKTDQHSYSFFKISSVTGFSRFDHGAAAYDMPPPYPGWETELYRLDGSADTGFFPSGDLSSDELWLHKLTLANWLIVTIYTVLWLGGLALWQRRKHRLMTNPLASA